MYTLRPAAIMACFFYKNPGAKIDWTELLSIAEGIKFPIFPDISLDTVIEATKSSSFFEIDNDGYVICTKYLTEIDMSELTGRLPDSLVKEIYNAS